MDYSAPSIQTKPKKLTHLGKSPTIEFCEFYKEIGEDLLIKKLIKNQLFVGDTFQSDRRKLFVSCSKKLKRLFQLGETS